MPKQKAFVALSGGVDSSVCALLLQQQGYEVVGITGKMVNTASADLVVENAKQVAQKLGIEHYTVDVTKEFQEQVIDYFKESYQIGETPNPCIVCNKFIKWGVLFDWAIEHGADIFATGHYADVKNIDGIYKLYPAKDEKKDQLYFLFALTQNQLSKTRFPLFGLTKSEIREIASKYDLPSKSSKESQDICFIEKPMTTKKYLLERIENKSGDFVEVKTGKVLGKHNGCFQYTVGQRKGIGIAAERPLYVIKTDPVLNIVYVGYEEDNYSESLEIKDVNWVYPNLDDEFEAMVKIRYNMAAKKAHIKVSENLVSVKFEEPISSITKGQAVVLYDINDGHLIGGAFLH